MTKKDTIEEPELTNLLAQFSQIHSDISCPRCSGEMLIGSRNGNDDRPTLFCGKGDCTFVCEIILLKVE